MDGLNDNAKDYRIEGRPKGQQWNSNLVEKCKGLLILYSNKSRSSFIGLAKYIYQDKK